MNCIIGTFLAARLDADEARPNIVVILADDLGYADVGVYGCVDIPTPHLDAIAEAGVRFTDGYATHPVCSPSRAGLLSGMYQHRFGFEHNSGPEAYASTEFGIPRDVPTLAERLQSAGYATGMVGKWHVGFREGLRPHERGFDTYYGFLSGAHSYFPGRRQSDSPIQRNGTPIGNEPEYLTDAFARESVAFVERQRDGDKPFFLYLAFNAVHSPLQATDATMARFDEINDRRRKIYAGMLTSMDEAVGRVMAAVRESGEESNTLVVFYSDNGGPTPQTTSRNDPLRGVKGQVFEGGIRVPFLMQWPDTIPAGITYEQPVMGFDVHATALAAAGIEPTDGPQLDGVDLIPYLTGEREGRPHDRLFWRSGTQHAVRLGDWKMVVPSRSAPLLFNLRDDVGEQRDRSADRSEKLDELLEAFDTWASQMVAPRWIRQDRRNAFPGGELRAVGERRPQGAGRNPRLRTAAQLRQRFAQLDADGDGKLGRDELRRFPNVLRADADGDGFVTFDEIRARFERRPRNESPEAPDPDASSSNG